LSSSPDPQAKHSRAERSLPDLYFPLFWMVGGQRGCRQNLKTCCLPCLCVYFILVRFPFAKIIQPGLFFGHNYCHRAAGTFAKGGWQKINVHLP
jgi:hypothetical protein